MSKKFIITGIGTDIGKTVVSAIFSEALEATYWKPIQAGDLNSSDSMKIRSLCSDKVAIFPEKFRLTTPQSPHAAAEIDGIKIELSDLQIPTIDRNLLIEGAGGLMVPLNSDGLLFVDFIQATQIPVILVSRNYLGSINHTLMAAEILKNRSIPVAGIVFVGEENLATETIILKMTKFNCLAKIPFTDSLNSKFIKEQAEKINIENV